jgi:hypothetical protein
MMKFFAVLRCAAGYLVAPKPPANANWFKRILRESQTAAMAGLSRLVPAIHVLLAPPPYPPPRAGEGREGEDVDARDDGVPAA